MSRRPPHGGIRGGLWWVYATLRTLYCWIALAIVTTLVGLLYILVVALAPESRFLRGIERFWVWFILRASFVRLGTRGLENLEPGRSYIAMANHRSMYDVPALHYLLGRGRDLRWVGKRELIRVPVFGWALALSRHVAIDRENRAQAIEALRRAVAASAGGVSFVIMPEGTRSTDRTLGPFKKGGFHLALDTGLPILPVAIVGSERLMRKGTWWILAGAIEVVVRPAVEVEGWTKDRLTELVDRVRREIETALPDLPNASERRSA